ncbi:hypothetical protein GbCGDNIH6_7251a [Granulibacter bethesdensis]|nr:hypothetical protein GbCGDNIH6_7251a [Granulibacter bethesdensis]
MDLIHPGCFSVVTQPHAMHVAGGHGDAHDCKAAVVDVPFQERRVSPL